MTESSGANPTGAFWTDRIFDAIPVAPVWVGAGFAFALVGLSLLLSAWFGDLADLLGGKTSFWLQRDLRLNVVLVILAAFVPTAERYAMLGARRQEQALLPLLGERASHSALRSGPGDARRRRTSGWLGLLLAPLTGLAIDRDPGLYLRSGSWGAENAWSWLVGTLLCFSLGCFVATTLAISRRFSQLAQKVPRDALFEPAALAPFGRMGLLFALLWLLIPSIFALNAMDRAFELPIALFGVLCAGIAVGALLLPVLGIHRRIREAKAAEGIRVMAAIRGEPGALQGSVIEARAASASLADLIAWKGQVDSLREWPFDAGMRLRFLLYLAIPLGSWLGGAVVDHLLAAALG